MQRTRSNSTMGTPRKGGKRESNNWQISKDLVGCLDHILASERMTDIAIVFPGQGKAGVSINAHKLLLAARSPVFESMFFGAESKKNRYFEETDIPPGPFKVLMRYIYTDTADLTAENVLHVLNASEKYKIPSLTLKCCSYLVPILSPATVCGVLETACNFGLLELQMRCFVYLDDHAKEILFTPGFCKLSRSVMAKVISRRTLDAPELDIYKAVVVWSETEMKRDKLEMTAENRRKTIGDQFSLLRIPCIPQQQFADHVVKDKLLTGEEVLQIFLNYTDSDKKPLNFASTKPRCPGLIRPQRFTSTRDITTADKDAVTGKISIETNEAMILLGFVVKGVKFRHLYEVCPMNKVEGSVEVNCGKTTDKIPIDIERAFSEKTSLEDIMFKRPILIEKAKLCELDFNVLFSRITKQLGQQDKDIQLMYTAGVKSVDTVEIGDLEVKFKVDAGGGLPWLSAFILSPFST